MSSTMFRSSLLLFYMIDNMRRKRIISRYYIFVFYNIIIKNIMLYHFLSTMFLMIFHYGHVCFCISNAIRTYFMILSKQLCQSVLLMLFPYYNMYNITLYYHCCKKYYIQMPLKHSTTRIIQLKIKLKKRLK